MNYYPFHLGDYAAHTAHLEPMEDLAYRRMLDLYYRTEQPLPSDWRQIARLIRLRDQGDEIEAVLSEFFALTDDGWRHNRCDAEIAKVKRGPRQELDVSYQVWRTLRAMVFARDGYACTYCGEKSERLECDHIHPVALGGTSDPGNLATACVPCNRSKGAKTLEQWSAK